MNKVKIAAIVLTYNEEINIADCLKTLLWCDEVVVVDSYSSDNTVSICRQYDAKVIFKNFCDFASQRNYAAEYLSADITFVLHLDADERVTEELREELMNCARSGTKTAYAIPFKVMMGDKWLRHSVGFPNYQVRFGTAQSLRFEMVGHGQRETTPASQIGYITNPIIHFSFSKGIKEWFSKHLRYAEDEAKLLLQYKSLTKLNYMELISTEALLRRRAFKVISGKFPFRPLLRFVYVYFFKGGVLDGFAGLRYALMMMSYQVMIDVICHELSTTKI